MWNLQVASKLISQRQRQHNYEMHKQKLEGMKGKIKISAPTQPEFVYTKHKLEMTRRDRLLEIDHQNQILLVKMQNIGKAQYTTNKLRSSAQNLKTLNQQVMHQQAQDIYNENKRICQKLLRVNSYYPTFQIIDQTNTLENIKLNISENARRTLSSARLRPHSSLTNRSKFYRTKVSKFDQEGNLNEKVFKLYQMPSTSSLRPQSAPSHSKQKRPYSSEHSSRRPRKTAGAQNVEQEGVLEGVKSYQM